jgi:signal transduction histidine kinase
MEQSSRSEFVALIAHKLRTPLSVIKWSAEYLLHSDISKFSSEEQKSIKDIAKETDTMASIIDQFLKENPPETANQ